MADLASLVVRFTAETSRYNAGLQDIRQRTQKLESDIKGAGERIQRSVSAIPKAIAGALAGIGTAQLARSILDQADRYQLLQGRLKLVTASSEQLAAVNQQLFEVAQRTRQPFEATAELFTRVAQNARDLGLTQQQLIGFTETISQAFLVSGASAQESAGAIRQLTQALASGVFRGEEFNSVAEQGPRIMQALTQSLGVTRGELRKMAEDGQLTAGVVIKAVQQQAAAIDAEFKELPTTLGQSLEQVRNELFKAFGSIDTSALSDAIADIRKDLSAPGGTDGLVAPLQSLTDGLAKAVRLADEFADTALTAAALGASVAIGRYGASVTASAIATGKAIYAQSQQIAVNAAAEASWAKLTAAQASETAAKVADIKTTLAAVQAARAEQIANLQSANAKAAATAATIQNIQATLTEGNVVQRTLQATLAAAQANRVRSASIAELALLGQQQARLEAQLATAITANTAAQQRAAAAATASAAATAATGLAARAAAAGMSVLNGALALVGGPAGLLFAAAAALTYFISRMESAEERATRLGNRLKELTGNLEDVSRAADIEELEQTQRRIVELDRAIADLQKRLITQSTTNSGGQGLLDRLLNSRASNKLKEYSEERAKLIGIEGALEDRINGVTAATEAGTQALLESGAETRKVSEDLLKQIALMEQTYALIQKGYSVEQARTRARLMEAGATEEIIQKYLKYESAISSSAEAEKRAADAIKERAREQERLATQQIESAQRVFDATRTPLERYRIELEKLEMMRARFDAGLPGGIDQETFDRAKADLADQQFGIRDIARAYREAQAAAEDYIRATLTADKRRMEDMWAPPAQQRYNAGVYDIEDTFAQDVAQLDRLRDTLSLSQEQYEEFFSVITTKQLEARRVWDETFPAMEEQARDFGLGFKTAIEDYLDSTKNLGSILANDLIGAIENAKSATADLAANVILWGESGEEAAKAIARSIITDLVSSLIEVGIQMAVNFALGRALASASLAATAAEASAAAAVWAPAAIGANIATFGGASAVGLSSYLAALGTGTAAAAATSLAGAAGFKEGGFTGRGPSDEIAGVVHRNEAVLNEDATSAAVKALNDPSFWALRGVEPSDDPTIQIISEPGTVVIRQDDGSLITRLAPALLELVDIDIAGKARSGRGRAIQALAERLGVQQRAVRA